MSRRVATAGFAVAGAVGWNVSNVGAVADELARDYGIALATVGLFTTVLFVTHTALQIPGGRAVDRLGARRMALLGLAILALSNVIALTEEATWVALVARGVAGIGTGCAYVAASELLRAASGSPLMQGLFGGVTGAAGGLGLAIVPQLERALDWRAPWLSALAWAALALVIVAVAPAARRTEPRPAPPAAAARLLRDRRLYRIAVPYTASLACGTVVGHWAVTMLERAGGYGTGTAGVIGGLTLAGGVVSRPLGGWVMRRHPERTRAALGASLVVGAVGTALLLPAGPPALSALGAAIVGLASGIAFAPGFTAAARLRPDAPGSAVALVNMIGNFGIVVGIPLLGLAFSLPGDGRIGFAIVAVVWAAAALVRPTARELGVH